MRSSRFAFLAALWIAAPAEAMLIFSPAGNGTRKTLSFILNVPESDISSWSFKITTKQSKGHPARLVREFNGGGAPPRKIIWDGKDMETRIVSDGVYLYSLSLVTPAGNQAAISPSPVVVDRVPPQASVSVEPPVFSPSGLKPEAHFSLSASDDYGIYEWLLAIRDKNGIPLKSWSGKGSPNAEINWDGRGDFQEDVPDGTYAFQLTVENLASNRATTPPQSVTIKRHSAVSTVQVSPTVFSPHKAKPTVFFNISGGDPNSVDHWELKIINQNGRTIRHFSGRQAPPARIGWDGDMSPEKTTPDGAYQVVLYETDTAGNTSAGPQEPLYIDTRPPLLESRLKPDLLAPGKHRPNSEGTFRLTAKSAYPFQWSLRVFNDVGEPVRTWSGTLGSKPPAELPWDGTNDSGQFVIDGAYSYSLWAKDIAGNEGSTSKQKFIVNTTPPVLSAQANHDLFSPDGDAALSHVVFALDAQDASPLSRWALTLQDASGKKVRVFTGSPEEVPPTVSWDGTDQDHQPLPDGSYSYVLSAADIAGNASVTAPKTIVIGATKPIPALRSDLNAISPNADGFKDTTNFHLSVKSFNPIREWFLTIRGHGRDGLVRRTFEGRGDVPGVLTWGGEGDDQKTLPDGLYSYQLKVIDKAGNTSRTLSRSILINTTPPALKVAAEPSLFSPHPAAKGFTDHTVFVLSYQDASPALKWKLIIQDRMKNNVRVFSGAQTIPISQAWDGTAQDGAALPDGPYTYSFFAEDDVGNQAVTPDQIIRLDATPPQPTVEASPALFSPGTGSEKDETTFLLDYKAKADIADWTLQINVASREASRAFSGQGRPPRNLPWDGKNSRGHILPDGSYKAVLSITDEAGNIGTSAPVRVTIDTSRPTATVVAQTEELGDLDLPLTVTRNSEKDIVISLASEVLFDTGKAALKSIASETLLRAAYLIKRYSDRAVLINGYTDNVPIHDADFEDNLSLSKARAEAVMKFLAVQADIPRSRMTARGYGEANPVDSNDTDEGRKKNRRVEIVLTKPAADKTGGAP